MTKEDIYNKYPQPHFRSDTIQMMEEYSKKVLESKIKEIEEVRDMITKPSPSQNMPASALTKFGHGFNSGINEAIEILKKGI